MIQLRDDICWVQADDGRATPFDGARLAVSIQRAAAAAGQFDWWPAEAVVDAVWQATRECCPQQTIAVEELARVVVRMLTMIGFPEVAQAYQRRRQYTEIRLDQMTAEASTASELTFYHQLDAALRVAGDDELALVQVRGLRACVMRLRGAQYWSENCRRLAEEILGHLRERVARLRRPAAGELRVTVVA